MMLTALGFLGGYLFGVIGFASVSGMPPGALVAASMWAALGASLVHAGVVGGWVKVVGADSGALIGSFGGEVLAVGGSFVVGAAGLRLALWTVA